MAQVARGTIPLCDRPIRPSPIPSRLFAHGHRRRQGAACGVELDHCEGPSTRS
jgi:hypothetical protein